MKPDRDLQRSKGIGQLAHGRINHVYNHSWSYRWRRIPIVDVQSVPRAQCQNLIQIHVLGHMAAPIVVISHPVFPTSVGSVQLDHLPDTIGDLFLDRRQLDAARDACSTRLRIHRRSVVVFKVSSFAVRF